MSVEKDGVKQSIIIIIITMIIWAIQAKCACYKNFHRGINLIAIIMPIS